ncbi:hypothetical protein CDAR_110851 [Caerostris darwini]|uniref:Uncharacterized protein n=1 Tax=Caerostris darwini TaxID=1538125 RepID=A0AAV4QQG0_9ARAC|nr:hypothetical protein CDAR_110851 [Caerostris darwini]
MFPPPHVRALRKFTSLRRMYRRSTGSEVLSVVYEKGRPVLWVGCTTSYRARAPNNQTIPRFPAINGSEHESGRYHPHCPRISMVFPVTNSQN